MYTRVYYCCCWYYHLPLSSPVSGVINKTASAAPFGSPARVPIILWSNINVWYWACSLIQSQLILSVNYLQILRCGGRSLWTTSARFRIWNWLPLFHPPPHQGLLSFSPPLSFPLFLCPSFLVYVCLLKPKWLPFRWLGVSGPGCWLGISITAVSDAVGWCWGGSASHSARREHCYRFLLDNNTSYASFIVSSNQYHCYSNPLNLIFLSVFLFLWNGLEGWCVHVKPLLHINTGVE